VNYFSIDIETTGLDENTCQIIELAAVYDDGSDKPVEQLEFFRRAVRHDVYHGEAYALSMHAALFKELADENAVVCCASELAFLLRRWMHHVEPRRGPRPLQFQPAPYNVAGKNFAGFDLRFLRKLPEWEKIPINHRYLDIGSALWRPGDAEVPGTSECMRRLGIVGDVSHTALGDARDVCRMIRALKKERAI
jgi:hypothetical protein